MHEGRVVREDFDQVGGGATLRVRRLCLRDGAGAGRPPIAFLHDSLGCISAWRDFPDRLCESAGCDGLVYDREGFGRSSELHRPRSLTYLHEEADILGTLLEQCGICRAMLFGHSDGGTIALLAAGRLAGVVPALVTVGAHVMVEEQTLAGLQDALPWWDDPVFRGRMERHHGDKAEQVFRVWADTWLSAKFRGWNMLRELGDIRCPTLVIQGERDEYATPHHVRVILDGLGGPREGWIVEGAGHTPYREDGRVLERAGAFLARFAEEAG